MLVLLLTRPAAAIGDGAVNEPKLALFDRVHKLLIYSGGTFTLNAASSSFCFSENAKKQS